MITLDTWSKEFPEREGIYWFYGRVGGPAHIEMDLYLAKIEKVNAETLAYIAKWYYRPKELDGQWKLCAVPSLPRVEAEDNATLAALMYQAARLFAEAEIYGAHLEDLFVVRKWIAQEKKWKTWTKPTDLKGAFLDWLVLTKRGTYATGNGIDGRVDYYTVAFASFDSLAPAE